MANRTIPIIKIYDVLLVSIQVELSDRLVTGLRDDVAQEIRRTPVQGLIIDVSGADILDSFIARSIRDLSRIGGLMGVRTVVVGLSAGIAITLVEMGMTMDGVSMALNLEQGLDELRASGGEGGTLGGFDTSILGLEETR